MTVTTEALPGALSERPRQRSRLLETLAFATSLVALQGVPFAAQWAGGRWLSAEAFGQVRVAEVLLGVLLLVGALGQPTSALRSAASGDEARRLGGFGGAVLIGGCGAVAVAAVAFVTAPATPWARGLSPTLWWLFWTLPFSTLARVIAARFQARREFLRCAAATALPAAGSVLAVSAGAYLAGLRGWTVGRVVGEVVPAAVLLWTVRREFTRPTRAQLSASLRFGAAMALSLALDRLAGGVDNLVLAASAPEPAALARYGAATLVTQAATLPAAAIIGVMLPEMIAAAHDPARFRLVLRRLLAPFAAGCAAIGAALLVAGPPLLNAWLGLRGATWPFFPLLVAGAAATALTAFGGAVLIALGRGRWAVAQSAVALAVNACLCVLLLPRYGVAGLATSAAVAALARVAVMCWLVRRGLE